MTNRNMVYVGIIFAAIYIIYQYWSPASPASIKSAYIECSDLPYYVNTNAVISKHDLSRALDYCKWDREKQKTIIEQNNALR